MSRADRPSMPAGLAPVTLLALASGLAGCVNEPAARDDAGTGSGASPGECRVFVLDNGQEVCLMTEPQGPVIEEEVARRGLSVEPLREVDWRGALPASVNLREAFLDGCLQVRNQNDCGWCVVHAVGTTLDALYCAEGCQAPRVSMPHVYANGHGGHIGDCGVGWSTLDALRSLTTTPLVHESVWPYTSGSRAMMASRPSDEDLRRLGRYRATGMRSIARGPNMLENFKRVLASGRAVTVWSGVCFNAGWSSGTAPIPAPTPPCARDGRSRYDGYHAYVLVGYDDATRTFLAVNSWGDDWGEAGFMRLTYDFVEQEVSGGGYLDQIDRDHGGCDPEPMPMPDGGAPDGGPLEGGVAADAGAGGGRDGGVSPVRDGGTSPVRDGGGAAEDGGVGPGPVLPTPAERCAAISNCATCAATAGCVYCDGRCVRADPSGSGPAEGRCTELYTRAVQCTVPPTDPCTAHTDCSACTGDDRCAWCQTRRTCLSWPSGWASCTDGRIATASDQCNDVTRVCDGARMCSACTAIEGCGWCGASSRCGGGDARGSDRLGCSGMWVGPGEMCPAPDAGTGGSDGGAPIRTDASTCGMAGSPCMSDGHCCDGLACVAGGCVDPASCGVYGRSCTSAFQCCRGLSCLPQTFGSTALQCCIGWNAYCRSDHECCGHMRCIDNVCVKRRAGESCAHWAECADGRECVGGVCR